MSKFTYILDPGHGGINPLTGQYTTSGKRSPKMKDGFIYYEGVGNRAIALKVGDQLKKLGIKYAYAVTPSEWQDVSLTERVRRINALISKGTKCVLISIHSNAHGNGEWNSANGYEVYTSPGQDESDPLATIWFEEMAKEFPELKGRPDGSDKDPDKEARFQMIMSPKCPSFLIEMAFHTNLKEAELLRSEKGQERMANVIVRTIQRIEK